jgi:N-formylglutamate amidohydrolase
MSDDVLIIHGPRPPAASRAPLVLDSPHSGHRMPADFGAAVAVRELRDGEDCFIDELWQPAAERGIPLLAAQFPRTYLDPNRHAGDIDLELLDEPWPHPVNDSGKGAIGKALVWRTLDKNRPIYDRRLSVAEVQGRIERCHRPYHAALADLLDTTHARFGKVYHLNCHSMGHETSVLIEGVDGEPRPDFVLGDRDGTTCEREFTAFVRDFLADLGYDVRLNDPFKGVELVRAYSDPAAGRHSLQIEINKRLYMSTSEIAKVENFARVQAQLMALIDAVVERFGGHA